MKIIVIGALPSSLTNFRGKLLEALVQCGYDTVAMASGASEDEIGAIEALDVSYIDYPVKRNGLNPIEDLKTFLAFRRMFRKERPDVILAYTIKPVIWGGLAARSIRRCRFYALITGLGFAFQSGNVRRNLLTALVKGLYRLALGKAAGVIFQNPDNQEVFVQNKILNKNRSHLVNGSGVDLSHFKQKPLTNEPKFLLIARLLGEKGVREYVSAAQIVKDQYPSAVFDLVGPEDPSPDGITKGEVNTWHQKGIINYHGEASDVRPFIEACNIFVLPSYHEGMPRTVLEAMATGRPILTTNVPGCKETVVDGVNGWLVTKENVAELADKMIWFIENDDEWQSMADASFVKATNDFDVHKVNEKLLNIMRIK